MALILSAATGNFNAGATWVGGIVPGAADEARASTTHVITITANVTCTELSNAGTGTYVLNNGVTLTANVTNKSATSTVNCLTFSAASPATATIVGNITGGTTTSAVAVNNSASGTLTVTGNIIGGSGNSTFGLNNTGTGSVNVTGNVNGGSSILAHGINNNSTGIVTVTGNSTGGTGSGNSPHGINNVTTGTITLTGSVTGGVSTGLPSYGINNASTGTLTITGGAITATNMAAAIVSRTGTNRISGSLISSSNGNLSVDAVRFIMLTTPALAKTQYALNGSGTYVEMFTADNSLGQAAITDVRFGTVYASGALTGVAYIPSASSVAFGVPVDNTTGTATLTAADVRAAIGMATANLDTQLAAIPTAVTNAAAVRTNLATELGRIDATISSRSTLTAANVRTELAPELTEITEVHAIHGLDIANALTVTPTSRTSGAITQAITGDGTTNTVVTRV